MFWWRKLPSACQVEAAPEPVSSSFTPAGCGHTVNHPLGVTDFRPSWCAATPASAPRFLHISFPTQDTTNAVAFNWVTLDKSEPVGDDPRPGGVTEVRYGTAPDALDSVATGHSWNLVTDVGDSPHIYHEVHVCGLQAKTTYYYVAGAPGAWSDVYTFTTGLAADDTDTSYRFAVTGDSRSSAAYELWDQVLGMIAKEAVDFHIFSGDAVPVGLVQAQWDGWFTAAEPELAEQFFMPANGNHDLLSVNYLSHFALPDNEENFAFRYGNGLFIALNDTAVGGVSDINGRVRDFLVDTLEANKDAVWRVVFHHRPIYSASTRHGSQKDLQDAWSPVYDQYNVDFVFNGHDHNYERALPVRDQQVVAQGQGTVYVVAAGVGAPLYDNGTQWWTAKSEKVPSYVIVDIDGKTLDYKAYRDDGTELDTLTLTKP
jgi:hypothetical protein